MRASQRFFDGAIRAMSKANFAQEATFEKSGEVFEADIQPRNEVDRFKPEVDPDCLLGLCSHRKTLLLLVACSSCSPRDCNLQFA